MIESELIEEEQKIAEEFFRKLGEQDRSNVERIIGLVDRAARSYFDSREHNYNTYAFTHSGKKGYPFFALYLIGGQINKEGERKDIDLLLATNMRRTDGYLSEGEDPIWGGLIDEFGEKKVSKDRELPDDYNLGDAEGKVLIEIGPEKGKKIDLCYVRSWPYFDSDRNQKFISEEEFIEMDVDTDGEPLQRLPLYRLSTNVEFPQLRW